MTIKLANIDNGTADVMKDGVKIGCLSLVWERAFTGAQICPHWYCMDANGKHLFTDAGSVDASFVKFGKRKDAVKYFERF